MHDPKFFFLSENRRATPALDIHLTNSLQTRTLVEQQLEVVKYGRVSRQNSVNPLICEADLDYSWTECFEKYVEAQIGCRLPWKWNEVSGTDICSTKEDVLDLLRMYNDNIGLNSSPHSFLIFDTYIRVIIKRIS